jgi:hypothetical protein
MHIHGSRRALMAAAAVFSLTAAATAVAAIPDSDGKVGACIAKANRTSATGLLGPEVTLDRRGTLRAIDTAAGEECRSDEQVLAFNVKGQKGDKGDTGSQGEQGPPGPEGPRGPAGVSGRQVVTESSANNSGDSKVVLVRCPDSKSVVGTGYKIDTIHALSDVTVNHLDPTWWNELYPNPGQNLFVEADETNPTDAPWALVAYAICA